MLNNIRIEEDLLDTREVPADAYYGVHTLGAIENFYISSSEISDIPESVRGMVMVKKAAVMTNEELQTIPKSVANAIIAACDEVLNNEKCMDQFPVDAYRGGTGTPVNMSTNEILVNIGLELTGHQKGEHQYLNPNDHVNKCQSANDTYPTGFRIAVYASVIKLVDTLNQLHKGFEKKTIKLQDILKMGRTQLQDVMSMALGQELHTLSILLKEEAKNISRITELLPEVNLGATAISTGLNTPRECSPLAIQKLAEVTDFACVSAEDLIEATSDCGAYVMVHGTLKRLAAKISKVCNDLRLLSSGPRASLSEISLPELQAGSSIMPTKVNPVVPKVINQMCFKIIGDDIIIIMASETGRLQLDVMEPVIGQVVFESTHILSNACCGLLEKCVSGITTNREVCEAFVFSSIGVVTHLNPFIGHHNGGIVGRICAETGKSVHEVVLERDLSTESKLDNIFSAQSLMHPAYKARCYTDESKQ